MTPLDAGQVALLASLAAGGLAASLTLDRWLRPGGVGYRRPRSALAIQAGLFLACWALLWLLLGRPGFAAALTLAGQGLVVVASNAKYRALREPMVCADLALYSQVFRFPRLYIPFLGVARAVAAALGLAAALIIGTLLEGPHPGGGAWAAGLLGVATLLLVAGTRAAPVPSLDPVADLHTLGLLPSLWLYGREEVARLPPPPPRPWLDRPRPDPRGGRAVAPLPDLLVVQSESFCDARRLYPGVRADLLPWFDALGEQALARGRLWVPAWGANTMRTEFAVLSGIAQDALGVHRFNPYRRFARRGCLALPHRLRALGYRTVCIHPHPAAFFGRDRVFPGLGFDEFIDSRGFPAAVCAGHYVADAAVTDKVAEVLAVAAGPVCLFVITMENHGPLHLEQVAPGDLQRFYRQPPPAGWEDLTIYLRHLVNADRQFGDLAAQLQARPRGGLLCVYGDHVPSMPRVYDDLGFTDPRTDYLIWSTGGSAGPGRDLAAHQLAELLLTLLHPHQPGLGAAAVMPGGCAGAPRAEQRVRI